ncbi:MAG: DUF1302 family protein [Sterolibacterium sp.]|nr:DUF1302 family protein [Sterolibacterium sp.]
MDRKHAGHGERSGHDGCAGRAVVPGRQIKQWTLGLPLGGLLMAGSAWAFEPVTFDNGAVLDVSTQISYTYMKRLQGVDPALVDVSSPLAINGDDGNRTVGKHGTISNRLGALVDVDLRQHEYRAFMRLSSVYDAALDRGNVNTSQATFNAPSASDQFIPAARDLVGSRTRLLDAYVQGRWKLADDSRYPLTLRAGRQVVAWGEGLHFMGISGAMNPVEGYKAQIPGTPIKEMFLPTELVSATLGLGSRLMLMGYGKWTFRESEMMPVNTYFSFNDLVGPGASYMRFGSGVPLGAWRAPDMGRKVGGQWGVGAKYQITEATDIGLYALRYNALLGLPEFRYGGDFWMLGQGAAALPMLANFAPASFSFRYMDDIKLTGASFSTKLGEFNVAGEVAHRSGAPVLMADSHYQLARARVTNAQLSAIRLWGPEFLQGLLGVDTVQASAELATSSVHGFDTPAYSGTPMAPAQLKFDKNTMAYAVGLTLKYTGVFPGWDVAVPIDWMHQWRGNPALQGWNSGLQGENDRRLGLGLNFIYQQNLELGVKLAHYLGKPDWRDHSFRTLTDRDFIAITASDRF